MPHQREPILSRLIKESLVDLDDCILQISWKSFVY